MFSFRLDVYLHHSSETAILEAITLLSQRIEIMSAALDRVQAEVTEMSAAVDSAIVLIEGLAQRIRDLATDPVALNAFADELDAKSNALAAAVVANTPTAEG